jgi:hypothetical protein
VLRIFGRKSELDGWWRKLYNDELQNLYSSPTIVRAIKSRTLGWAAHVARMGEGRGIYRVLVGKKVKLSLCSPGAPHHEGILWE